ncbi:POK18 protein, partial [Bucorvus abyssinicus]|nr:POK18 protein [Bucorvus abyssinicus]
PWNYLGWKITQSTTMPQKPELRTDVKTLNDVQKLVGDINWVHPICGVTNADMAPLL